MSETSLINRLDQVLLHLRAEVLKACTKHAPMHSPHEGHSVIREELEELWDHVKADTGKGEEARKEALQVAAMGIRYVLDVAPLRPPCAACDRGDYQLGHADGCPKGEKPTSEGDRFIGMTLDQIEEQEKL